ncbi:uncharacterized protein LOC126734271 isoform X2 [Anthonomus grandis grandis]|uniref:uncharacterized protein LOC126734271 isoform X2 n=1 Tax=Anthonomus grandis grandis TaxID=2921223 RepID=UPI002166AEEE|nr:uncharacterized protein LOC126734271 isoform X2 [Anthonomus grandis grandis]
MSVIRTVLSTELTSIPSSLHQLFGDNFNNTLCNGVTWFVILWCIVHSCFEKILDVYLKRQCFPQYLRIRLTDSLWLLSSYLSYMSYFIVTTNTINLGEMLNFKRRIDPDLFENLPTHIVVAQAALCAFYLYMGYSEGNRLCSVHSFFKYIVFVVVCSSAYTLRILELPFVLTALLSFVGIFEELSKIMYSLLDRRSKLHKIFIGSIFSLTAIVYFCCYFTIIPVFFLIPLGINLFYEKRNLLRAILFFSLLLWLNIVIYKSMLLNMILHRLYHKKEIAKTNEDDKTQQSIKLGCLSHIIECSLFPPRTDESYILAFYRSEAKERRRRLIAKRKPKNQNMILQTLKCMMALRRKLSEKRSQNVDEENSEDGDNSEPKITFSEKQVKPLRKSSKALTISEELVPLQTSNVIEIDDEDTELCSTYESELNNVLVEEGETQDKDASSSKMRY